MNTSFCSCSRAGNYLECGRILRCCASRSCCWMRYCWCKAWGRNGGPGTSWNWGGVGRAVRGGWCAGGRCVARPVWGGWPACPSENSAEMGAWGEPRWKCRQEVAWLCWCLVKCAPTGDNVSCQNEPVNTPRPRWGNRVTRWKQHPPSLSRRQRKDGRKRTQKETWQRWRTDTETPFGASAIPSRDYTLWPVSTLTVQPAGKMELHY